MGLFDDLIPAARDEATGVPRITVTPRAEIPASGRQLLDAIAGSESPGYNVKYGGGTFDNFADHPRDAVPITSGPNAGKTSSAAGRYQFLGSTWDQVKKEAGLPDFSPESQDAGAWHLANKTYRERTGRDLTADLESSGGNPNAIRGIGQALSKVWTSLPGGAEPNRATASFASRYDGGTMPTDLSAQSRRSMGLFDDLVPQGQVASPPDAGPPSATSGGQPAQPAPVGVNTEGLSNRMAREGASPPVATAGQAFASGALKGATFNFADELAGTLAAGGFDPKDPVSLNNATALMRGLWRRATGDSEADAAYRVTTSAVREALDRHREQQPAASIGGELTGALVTAPVTGGGGVARGAGIGARALAGAKGGAVYGAISGAGEGTDAESRLTGAVTGGLVGGAVGAPLGAVLPAGKAATSVATSAELKAAARAGFESAPIKELEIAPQAISDFGQRLRAKLNDAGIDENLAPKTFGVLSKVEGVPADATAVTGANLQSLRRTFQMAASSIDKTERMAASKAIEAIDEFIPNIAARDILSGDAKAAAQAWGTARGNYAAAMRSDEIAKAVIKAQRQAEAAGSGANIDNATRQNFKAILNSDKRSRGFNADELAAMEQAVRGTTWGNFARLIGKAAPTGIVSGGLSSGAGFAAGGPVGAIMLPIAGFIAKKLGDRSTAKQVAALDDLVRSRAPLSNSMQEMATKAAALETTKSPRTMSAAVIAARNLANNLKDAGISMSPGDIIRALQAPATSRAEDNQ